MKQRMTGTGTFLQINNVNNNNNNNNNGVPAATVQQVCHCAKRYICLYDSEVSKWCHCQS